MVTSDISSCRGDPDGADAVFACDTAAFKSVVYGKQAFDAAEADGRFRIEGDRVLAKAFVGLFALPEKIA